MPSSNLSVSKRVTILVEVKRATTDIGDSPLIAVSTARGLAYAPHALV